MGCCRGFAFGIPLDPLAVELQSSDHGPGSLILLCPLLVREVTKCNPNNGKNRGSALNCVPFINSWFGGGLFAMNFFTNRLFCHVFIQAVVYIDSA